MTSSKYRNVRQATADGITHSSKMEARRWLELQLLERAGEIRNLRRQVPFEVAPAVLIQSPLGSPGKQRQRTSPALRYLADFVYFDVRAGKEIVEDCKGAITDVYRIKRHLMKAFLGIDIFESQPRRH
jgi:hypothetical protein